MSGSDDRKFGSGQAGAEEQAALDALRRLPPERAPEDVRARARAAFLHAPAGHGPVRRRPRRAGWLAAFAAAAAVALLFYGSMPRDSWVIVDVHMGDEVRVDGRLPVPGVTVASGPVHTTPCSEVELAFEEDLRLRFLSDARAELPKGPGRWLGRSRTLEIEQGEVYGSTGGAPLDFRLYLKTDEATAVLTGTTFAAIRLEDATCFCLFSGSIEFTPHGSSESIELPVGQRVFIYRDGREPQFEPLSEREQMKLQMIHDAGQPAP